MPSHDLDQFAGELTSVFDKAGNVENAKLPVRNIPQGVIIGIRVPERADSKRYVCAFGPCRYYTSQVLHLPTVNETDDGEGIMHSVRTHHCEHFNREIEEEYIFDCDAHSPRLLSKIAMWFKRQSRTERLKSMLAPQ